MASKYAIDYIWQIYQRTLTPETQPRDDSGRWVDAGGGDEPASDGKDKKPSSDGKDKKPSSGERYSRPAQVSIGDRVVAKDSVARGTVTAVHSEATGSVEVVFDHNKNKFYYRASDLVYIGEGGKIPTPSGEPSQPPIGVTRDNKSIVTNDVPKAIPAELQRGSPTIPRYSREKVVERIESGRLKILVSQKARSDGAIADAFESAAVDVLSRFPDGSLDHIKSVRSISQSEIMDRLRAFNVDLGDMGPFGGVRGYSYEGDVVIDSQLARPGSERGLRHTLAHEITHAYTPPPELYNELKGVYVGHTRKLGRRSRDLAALDEWWDNVEGPKAISPYAMTNFNEYRSETIAEYLQSPKTLKRFDPKAYEALQAHFGDAYK